MSRILWLFLTGLGLVHSYRLPTSVLPRHYTLEIITNLGDDDNNFDFLGKVSIEVKCVEPTQNITLHLKDLEIQEKDAHLEDLTKKEGDKPKIEKFDYIKDNEFLTMHLSHPLEKGHKYKLYLPFSGKLQDGLAGYYRSSYTDNGSKTTKWLAVTQFEPTYARKAFPCFDEPAMKATFKISLGRKEKYSTISNMPISVTEPMEGKSGWFWDRFENSVAMSTYLVAYVVSDFAYKVSEPNENNVTFRTWARKDALKQVEYAREIGPKVLNYYEKFFNIKYPLPKQDMIALPDFNAGAMENWGLITYRESLLLFDPEVSPLSSKHRVAGIIAHELAHQWFGNLVTMKWWSDLWLNEGFATYMAGLAVQHIYPQWNSLEEEDVDNLLNVFSFDALETSHPVTIPVERPGQINEMFDTISYKKGSSLIRMMYNFLGDETLRKGVSNYLEKHKYVNAEQDDLWESLTKEAHESGTLPHNLTVKNIMDTWTLQTGYPIVNVKRLYEKNSVELEQKRFLSNSAKLVKSNAPCWWIPISYTTQDDLDFNNTKPKHWLSCDNENQVYEGLPPKDKWVIFNNKIAGLYRVNYDSHNWKLLIAALNSDSFKKISLLNRVQLLDDSADLAWTGDLGYDVFFDILKYLGREEAYLPWKTALSNVGNINGRLKRTAHYGLFSSYIKKILTPIYMKIGGFEETDSGDNLDKVYHQTLITSWACKFDVANCVSDALKVFKNFQETSDDKIIPKDFRNVVYCTALKYGGDKEWSFLWKMYQQTNVATEKSAILRTLSCTREIWLLRRYLEWTLDDESLIRKQDMAQIFSVVANNDVGYYIAKDFFETRIGDIHKKLASNTRRLTSFLAAIAVSVSTDKELDEFNNFIKKNSNYFTSIKQGAEQAMEKAKLNVQWQKKHYQNIEKILAAY